MIDCIIRNKEWLFSGLGVAIFMSIGGLILRWILSHRRKSQGQSQPNQLMNHPEQTTTPVPQTSNPFVLKETLKNIIDDIDSRPLYQQDDIKKHYIGALIRYEGALFVLSKKDMNNVNVVLVPGGHDLFPQVVFELNINDYPQIKFEPKKAPMVVEGKIVEFTPGGATLKDVKIDMIRGKNKK
jgi:hypothetical protein